MNTDRYGSSDYVSGYDDGGALYLRNSNALLIRNIFQNNSAFHGGVLYVADSNLTFTGNAFHNNTATGDGGVLYAVDSTLSVTNNTFLDQNSAIGTGGVFFVEHGNFTVTGNTFQNNSAGYYGGVLYVVDSTLTVTDNTFKNNSAGYYGGVLYLGSCNVELTITDNTFQSNFAGYHGQGGVLYVVDSTFIVTANTFQNNSAGYHGRGGVLCVVDSTLTVTGNAFQNNSAGDDGGVLQVGNCNLTITGNTFQNNFAGAGGVLYAFGNTYLTVIDNTFQNNSAGDGGVFSVQHSILTITDNIFQKNYAKDGGILSVERGDLTITNNTFQNNSATRAGGVLHVAESIHAVTDNIFQNNYGSEGGVLYVMVSNLMLTENTFQNNSADIGGVLYIVCSTLNLIANVFQKNVGSKLGGAIFAYSPCHYYDISTTYVRMHGSNIIENNRAEYGGGIAALGSQLELEGNSIKACTASYGGGVYVHNTDITGNLTLINNSATEAGGGMYVSRSTVNFTGNTTFINNSAIDGNGGGLLLSGESQFYLQPNAYVYFISNSAKSNGGAIMVAESNPLAYCIDSAASHYDLRSSDCFFQIITLEKYEYSTPSGIKGIIVDLKVGIFFDSNSAEAGADLYGGSVDNCLVNSNTCPSCSLSSGELFDNITFSKNALCISSVPLDICTCSDHRPNCTGFYYSHPVYPGGTLEVPVIARGQRNGTTPAVIQIISTPNSNITFQENEHVQNVKRSCTTLKYTIQSFEESTIQDMTLHAQGPCLPTISNTLTIFIKILHCPSGFQLSDTHPICICTKRLQPFTNTCIVDNGTIHRMQHAQFWVGYDNRSDHEGVIIHPHCPFDYCTSEETYLAVNDSDKQCNYNRSGLLCGRCSGNLSLALGTSRCLQCSNSYLTLLVAFSFAGIALALLLLALRLTVAVGTINGLIFYANVVAVNSAIFFQPQTTNVPTLLIAKVLTLFIAWLNLDLGIETCFYDGMDAYVKTWLQFAFPLYVWALVGIIILGSHYSGRVANALGSNPIAVLATLFLLSYAKLLRTVIAALSYTFLEYPNNSHIAVWLYDGNIRYLSGKHIPLFTVALLCLVFLFFPFMMLLIFSQWLQAKSKFKLISWINTPKVKPFLDAYHAPYTDKHRYWTGLMLLLRLVLFLIFAVNALGEPSVNLLAIASSTAAVLTLYIISGTRIYKTWSLGLLEASFILNLAILAVATLYIHLTEGNQNAATFTSIGIAFATFTGIVIYHSVKQIKGTRLCRRVCLRYDYTRVPLADDDSWPDDPPELVFMPGSAPTQTVVDIRDSQLREPCIESD